MPTEITCVILNASNADERVECVGGRNWTKGELTVIAEIEGGARYNVRVAGVPIPVKVVVASHGRRKYLKTVADGLRPDSLLALPRCSVGRS
jgi:hypothetical protein